MRIAVTGATGFIGRHTVQQLLEDKHEVIAVAHNRPATGIFPNSVAVKQASVEDTDSLTQAFENVEGIIHLVGIIAETRTKTFEKTVSQGTRNVAAAGQVAGVQRIVYNSAIGAAADAASKYHRTKFEAESAVISSGLEYVILRPSLVYGPGDGFVSLLEKMIRLSPLTPIPGTGRFKLQPIFVGDLVRVISCAATKRDVSNETVVVAGPDQLEYLEILDLVKKALEKKRLNFYVPMSVMKLLAIFAEALLKPAPITRDQLLMMSMGNVGDISRMRQLCGVEPITMQKGLFKYLR